MSTYTRGRSEWTVGLFAIGAVLVFILLFGGLTSRGVIRTTYDLYVTVPTAEGLLRGDAVLFRGVHVGEVRAIEFSDRGAVVIRAKLRRRLPLTRSSTAALSPVDMFGRKAVVLREGHSAAPPVTPGDTLAGARAESLTDRIAGVGGQIERIIGDSTVDLVHDALGGIGAAADRMASAAGGAETFLAAQGAELTELTTALASLARTLDTAADAEVVVGLRDDLAATMANLARMTARMDSASANLATVLTRIEGGEGTAGRILGDPTFYVRAHDALDEFSALLRDLRENPSRYVTVRLF